jgi:hypothetical protein
MLWGLWPVFALHSCHNMPGLIYSVSLVLARHDSLCGHFFIHTLIVLMVRRSFSS